MAALRGPIASFPCSCRALFKSLAARTCCHRRLFTRARCISETPGALEDSPAATRRNLPAEEHAELSDQEVRNFRRNFINLPSARDIAARFRAKQSQSASSSVARTIATPSNVEATFERKRSPVCRLMLGLSLSVQEFDLSRLGNVLIGVTIAARTRSPISNRTVGN